MFFNIVLCNKPSTVSVRKASQYQFWYIYEKISALNLKCYIVYKISLLSSNNVVQSIKIPQIKFKNFVAEKQ